jgi:TRAP-type C4-dicarboxylate transport system permease small subunit
MGEIKAAFSVRMQKIIDVTISLSAIAITGFIAWVTVSNISKNLANSTPTLGIPFWIFLGATFLGFSGAMLVHLIHLRKPPQADTNIAV